MKIEIYGTPDCRVCKQAVKMCEANDLNVSYIDIAASQKTKTDLEGRIGSPVRSVPQIFVDNTHVSSGFPGLRTIIIDNS